MSRRRLELAGAAVEVQATGDVAEEVCAFVLGPRDPGAAHRIIRLEDTATGLRAQAHEDAEVPISTPGQAAAWLGSAIVRQLTAQPVDGLWLHAAAVVDARRAWLIPGISGAGKSTLAAALVHAGLALATDELVALHPDRVTPWLRPPHLKTGSAHVVRPWLDDATPDWARWRGGQLVAPTSLGAVHTGPVAVAGLLCPAWSRSVEPHLASWSAGDATTALLHATFDRDRDPGATLRRLSRLATSVPRRVLHWSAPGDLPRLIAGLERLR